MNNQSNIIFENVIEGNKFITQNEFNIDNMNKYPTIIYNATLPPQSELKELPTIITETIMIQQEPLKEYPTIIYDQQRSLKSNYDTRQIKEYPTIMKNSILENSSIINNDNHLNIQNINKPLILNKQNYYVDNYSKDKQESKTNKPLILHQKELIINKNQNRQQIVISKNTNQLVINTQSNLNQQIKTPLNLSIQQKPDETSNKDTNLKRPLTLSIQQKSEEILDKDLKKHLTLNIQQKSEIISDKDINLKRQTFIYQLPTLNPELTLIQQFNSDNLVPKSNRTNKTNKPNKRNNQNKYNPRNIPIPSNNVDPEGISSFVLYFIFNSCR